MYTHIRGQKVAKGMRVVLQERELWSQRTYICYNGCADGVHMLTITVRVSLGLGLQC